MRIVLSNASFKWGGVHYVTELLARRLPERGHEVVVFGRPGSLLQARIQGVAMFEPLLKGMDLHPQMLWRTGAALRRHRTDIVLAMMKKDVRVTVPAAWTLGIPTVIRHANDRGLTGGIYDRVFFGRLGSAHIANSEATRRTLLESAPWLRKYPMTVIHNGIDMRPLETGPKADLGLPRGALAIGFIGRLEVRKGLLDLAKAWHVVAHSVPNAHLMIAGSGPEENKARALLAEAPRVHWLGYRRDVPEVLRSLDILAVPSHWEGFGLIAAEALAAGVPVVAARASSLPEIITDGVHGRLVPPRDSMSLAVALVQMSRDPIGRRKLAVRGQARVRTEFGVDRMVDAYEGVFETVLRNRAAKAGQALSFLPRSQGDTEAKR